MATVTAASYNLPAKSLPTNAITISKDYTFASFASGDVLQVAQLPAGARVTDVDIYYAALGASTTLSVGTQASATYFVNAQSSSSAGRTRTAARPLDITSSNNQVLVTVGGAAATGAITVTVTYTMDP